MRTMTRCDNNNDSCQINNALFKFKSVLYSDLNYSASPSSDTSSPSSSLLQQINESNESNNNNNRIPSKRSGHRAVCDQSNLYIWGGYCPIVQSSAAAQNSPLYPELWRFNFASRKWHLLETSGDAPKTVASHSVVLHGSNMIVYGGTGFPFGAELDNHLYICNLKTLKWSKLETHGEPLTALYGSSLVLVNNNLYILFGTTSYQYYSNVYKINLKTLETVKLFDSLKILEQTFNNLGQGDVDNEYRNGFLFGRYRQEVVLHNNEMWVFGGGLHTGESVKLDELAVFNLDRNKWRFVQTQPADSNSYPEPRKFHTCVKVKSNVYVFGGVYYEIGADELTLVKNCIWKLDLDTLKWQQLNIKMPILTYFHASASCDGQAYFHGGVTHTNGREKRINDLFTINLCIPNLSELCWQTLLHKYPSILTTDKKKLQLIGFPIEFLNRIN